MASLDQGASSGFYDEDMQEELGEYWAKAITNAKRGGASATDIAVQSMFIAAGAAINARMTVEQFLSLARTAFKEGLEIELEDDNGAN